MFGPFKYGTLPVRTHLSAKERAVWAAFMQQYPAFCDKIWYDVECGGMRGGTDGLKPEWSDNAKYLGRYKIDVVGETDKSLFIFEVKGEATTKALGELWLYDDLLREEWHITKPIRCICITDEEMPNIRQSLEKEGYELIVTGPVSKEINSVEQTAKDTGNEHADESNDSKNNET